ncbi:MAG: InlB B-repeat-containing protein [Clostridia bacterium]|nr:InlB B-repeat-containing protein [Clostridia bacterium]
MNKPKMRKIALAVLGVLFALVASFLIVSVVATTEAHIEQNGSRLTIQSENAITSYQWQISDTIDGTYTSISEATSNFYDITAEDQGKYIKAVVNGAETEAYGPIGKLVVLDIGKGAVKFASTYSGNDSDGNAVSGDHDPSNIYVITHKEKGTKTKNNIVFDGNHSDAPFNVTLDGVNMGATPTNHNQAPGSSGVSTPSTGQISIPATQSAIKKVTLVLKGENQVRNITYYNAGDTSVPQTVDSYLKITDINGAGTCEGSLYIPYKIESEAEINEFVASKTNYNHWNAGIGGIDSYSLVQNLHLAGGRIQVATTLGDNCTAIGAGGNGYCQMTISGGEVIAHCNGTGAAIGGGIGWNAAGGRSDVTITGGKIYAKNHSEIKSGDEIVGGVAIGSGSSFHKAGSEGKVTITGGSVEAYGTFGNGIGGGNSSTSTGGAATITITGGTVKASSIGGGDSKNGTGGKADVDVSGTADITLTKGIGGGNSKSGAGGQAEITVNGGTMKAGGSIGGGAGGGTGNGGKAIVIVNNGKLYAASIGGGLGSIGGNGGAAEVTIHDGFIETGSIGGGKTLNETNGKLGYAKATITGGDISGQFLMAAGGTDPCVFTMTGGRLHDVNTADTSKYKYANINGAAVYMDDPDGTVSISGGTIENCSSAKGGAIYMSAGTCNISQDTLIKNCQATADGGAIYMGGGTLTVSGGNITDNSAQNGGGAFVNGGNVFVTGGSISANKAALNGGGIAVNNGNYQMVNGHVDSNQSVNGSGGGIYVSANGNNVLVGIYSGSVSSNTSGKDGGALAVEGAPDGTDEINVQIGVGIDHQFDAEGTPTCDHDIIHKLDTVITECPDVNSNSATESGGAIYVTGNTKTSLDIFCLCEDENAKNNAGGDDGQSNFMKMEGGKVNITTSHIMDDDNESLQTDHYGNTKIFSSIYVTGGQMDLWGKMTNPSIKDIITVDVTQKEDYFIDHRLNPDNAEEKFYKLLYYENFKDPVTGVITGQYKEYEIPHGQKVTIDANIYSHPGYNIVNWNTKDGWPDENGIRQLDECYPKDNPTINIGWYEIGYDYLFDGNPIGDLKIYAIWEANGYTVSYDPNISSGSYTGKMDNSDFTYDVSCQLRKNDFKRPGYDFIGWSKDKEPNAASIIYEDEAWVTNLTTKNEKVTLYAQWKECDHNPSSHIYTYSVVVNNTQDQTLKRTCSCNGYSEEARLWAEDAVYDKNTHPASTKYSSAWQPTVTYVPEDPKDVHSSNLPYFAGAYTASITDKDSNGVWHTASVTYTIEKADQPAPSVPTFDPNITSSGSTLSVKPVDTSPISNHSAPEYDPYYNSKREYRIVYFEGETEVPTEWRTGEEILIDGLYAARFELDKALTNYYVQARYGECADYKASPISTAESIYFFAGEVQVIVDRGDGVDYTIVEADGSTLENGINLKVFAVDGYFLPKDYQVTIETVAEDDANAQLTKLDGDGWNYNIHDIPDNCIIYLTLPDANKNVAISSKIAERQVFGTITTQLATISRDSAYTVYFNVDDYNSADYDVPVVSFTAPLPHGATIILQDEINRGYYWTSIDDAAGKSSLKLTDFVRMGDGNKTPFALSEKMEFHLVVDFSKAETPIAGDSLTTSLSAAHLPQSNAASATDGKEAILKNVDTFDLQKENNTLLFAHSNEGAASKWDYRENALVLIPKTELPEDAHLSLVCGNDTALIYANRDGNFIYSLPKVNQGQIQVSLKSSLLPEGVTSYSFDVDWIVAKSKAELSPMNATSVASVFDLSVQGIKERPVSLKISTANNERIYTSNNTIDATIAWADLPSNYTLKVVLMRKSDKFIYSSTGVTKEIEPDTEEASQNVSLSLAGTRPGSYRLQVTAEQGLIAVAEAQYYFIIK